MHPLDFPFFQAFVGDVCDNISGIKGVGPKTAVKLINQYKIIDNFQNDTEGKYFKNLDSFNESLTLVTLSTSVPLEKTEFTKQNFKNENFRRFCESFEIRC